MAARAGHGIELDLDRIPRRALGLTPYEILLSESQERMLMVAKAGREEEVFEVCRKWDLDFAVVGRVTDTGRFVCKATPGYDPLVPGSVRPDPQVVVDIPIAALTDDAPVYDRPQQAPPPVGEGDGAPMPDLEGLDLARELVELVGSPNIGSRQWIWRQYDHLVRVGTIHRPGQSDAAVIRAFCGPDGDPAFENALVKYLALSVDGNGRHVLLDPWAGAAMAVAECARNVVCAGGEPLGLTDCLNFGSPENPHTMWRFARAIEGIRDACLALGVPVVSGNVSFYNETEGRPILPTPTVAIVGQLASIDDRLGLAFLREGDRIAHLGMPSRGALGGSEFRVRKTGAVSGDPVGIDLGAEKRLQACVLALARARLLHSAHDVSDGGFAVAMAESCIACGLGCRVSLPGDPRIARAARLFSEEPSRVIVSFAPSREAEVRTLCARFDVPCEVIGEVGGDALRIEECLEVPVTVLAEAYHRCLEAIVGG
jgi:phosphoribosylformylglycinamidine synthase